MPSMHFNGHTTFDFRQLLFACWNLLKAQFKCTCPGLIVHVILRTYPDFGNTHEIARFQPIDPNHGVGQALNRKATRTNYDS